MYDFEIRKLPRSSKLQRFAIGFRSDKQMFLHLYRQGSFVFKYVHSSYKRNQTVFNLYGGIFAWKDAGYSLKDSKNKTTMRVHTFSKNWEDYLKTGIPVH